MNNMNTIAILCLLPLVIITLVFTKFKGENSTISQKTVFYIIYRLLPLTSLFIWSNMLLNSCNK